MTATTRVAVVTGAARGIGLAVAQRLVADGLRVAILDRDAPAATAAAQGLNRSAGEAYIVRGVVHVVLIGALV